MSKCCVYWAAASLLALAACDREQINVAPPATRADVVEQLIYQCGAATARFSETDAGGVLEVDGDKTIYALKAIPAASGARYEGRDVQFWSKGDHALLTVKGVDYPECVERGATEAASGGRIFKASGSEPGWLLELGTQTFRFTGDYGDVVVGGATPTAERLSDGTLYTIPERNLSIRVYDRLCNDDATGAPKPKQVTVTFGDKAYRGCGGEGAGLLAGEWKITGVGETDVVPGSAATVGFDKGAIRGNASCNRYAGRYEVTAEGIVVRDTVATEMACVDQALMDQERRVLEALASADRFDIAESGELVLYAGGEEALRARR